MLGHPTIIRAVLMIPNHCSHKNQRPSHIAMVLKIEKKSKNKKIDSLSGFS